MTRRRRRPTETSETSARRMIEALEQRSRTLLQLLPVTQPLACKHGCDHCCAQRVSVTPLEVFEIVDDLRRNHSPTELEAVLERIQNVAIRVRGRTIAEQRGIRCPLDDAGSCRVYASRPLLCRGANSFDARACATPGAAIPSYNELSDAAQTVQERLDDECERISGRAQMLELSCALAIALADPLARTRWRAGEPVFQDAAHSWFEAGTLRHWSRA